jgi:hypothetical protein
VSKQWHGSDKGAELINFVLVLFQGERERASARQHDQKMKQKLLLNKSEYSVHVIFS